MVKCTRNNSYALQRRIQNNNKTAPEGLVQLQDANGSFNRQSVNVEHVGAVPFMKRALVRVDELHIYQGAKRNCSHCPVAHALLESVPDAQGVSATELGLFVVTRTREFNIYPVPKKVLRFMCRFDQGKPVKPFNFYFKPS